MKRLRQFCVRAPEAVFFGGMVGCILIMLAWAGVAFAAQPGSVIGGAYVIPLLAMMASALFSIVLALVAYIFTSKLRETDNKIKTVFSLIREMENASKEFVRWPEHRDICPGTKRQHDDRT